MKTINLKYADRIVAFLGVNGKVYSSDCDHQECLEMYYKDAGIKSEFDYSKDYDTEKEKAVEKTFAMKNAHIAYGFDLFDVADDEYALLAHDKETFEKNKKWMESYRKENNSSPIELGYFLEGGSWEAEIVA